MTGGHKMRAKRRAAGIRAAILIPPILLLTVLVLHAMGRPSICTCGTVKLWHGIVDSAENSQQFADWYSLSHVVHGILFYAGLWLPWRRRPVAARFVVAVLVEAAWEILENSPVIIDRYRTATIALGYTGDSVLNSVSDILMMMIGFLAAARLPVWASVALAVALELVALAVIRDNLALNILMLVWPIEAVRSWQGAG